MRKLFALVFLFPILAFGADPDVKVPVQVIEGIESPAPLGELVQLQISQFEPPEHFHKASYDWILFDTSNDTYYTRYRTTNNNQELFFGSGLKPKLMKVVCVATYLYVDDIKAPGFIHTKTVAIKGDLKIGVEPIPPKPDPDDPDDPDEPDEPDLPDGKYGLAKSAYQWAKKVNSPKKSDVCKALADSFGGMASSISAGTLKDIKKILEETTKSNQNKLKELEVDKAVWDRFFVSLQDRIYELYSKGDLSKPDDFKEAWLEIVDGLKAAAK